MKLSYLSHAKIPSQKAHTVHIMKMCSAFAAEGVEVDLIAAKPANEQLIKDPYDFYSVDPDFSIRGVRWFNSLPGKYYLFGLMSALKSIGLKGDLVYGRYLFGVWGAWLLGKDVVFEAHSDLFNRDSLHRKMAYQLIQSPRCRGIIVISKALKQAWIDQFPEVEGKIFSAHDGADPPDITPSISSPKNGPTVAYAGSMQPGKGMELIAELIPICPDIKFVIAGGSDEEIRQWRVKIGPHSNVKFLGFIPHSGVNHVLMDTDILLAPYQERVEVGDEISRWMSPLKIFEYMAAKRPVICSDMPVLREVLKDGKNALLVPGNEPGKWKAAIEELKENQERAEELATNAYNDFIEEYTWRSRARKILEFIS